MCCSLWNVLVLVAACGAAAFGDFGMQPASLLATAEQVLNRAQRAVHEVVQPKGKAEESTEGSNKATFLQPGVPVARASSTPLGIEIDQNLGKSSGTASSTETATALSSSQTPSIVGIVDFHANVPGGAEVIQWSPIHYQYIAESIVQSLNEIGADRRFPDQVKLSDVQLLDMKAASWGGGQSDTSRVTVKYRVTNPAAPTFRDILQQEETRNAFGRSMEFAYMSRLGLSGQFPIRVSPVNEMLTMKPLLAPQMSQLLGNNPPPPMPELPEPVDNPLRSCADSLSRGWDIGKFEETKSVESTLFVFLRDGDPPDAQTLMCNEQFRNKLRRCTVSGLRSMVDGGNDLEKRVLIRSLKIDHANTGLAAFDRLRPSRLTVHYEVYFDSKILGRQLLSKIFQGEDRAKFEQAFTLADDNVFPLFGRIEQTRVATSRQLELEPVLFHWKDIHGEGARVVSKLPESYDIRDHNTMLFTKRVTAIEWHVLAGMAMVTEDQFKRFSAESLQEMAWMAYSHESKSGETPVEKGTKEVKPDVSPSQIEIKPDQIVIVCDSNEPPLFLPKIEEEDPESTDHASFLELQDTDQQVHHHVSRFKHGGLLRPKRPPKHCAMRVELDDVETAGKLYVLLNKAGWRAELADRIIEKASLHGGFIYDLGFLDGLRCIGWDYIDHQALHERRKRLESERHEITHEKECIAIIDINHLRAKLLRVLDHGKVKELKYIDLTVKANLYESRLDRARRMMSAAVKLMKEWQETPRRVERTYKFCPSTGYIISRQQNVFSKEELAALIHTRAIKEKVQAPGWKVSIATPEQEADAQAAGVRVVSEGESVEGQPVVYRMIIDAVISFDARLTLIFPYLSDPSKDGRTSRTSFRHTSDSDGVQALSLLKKKGVGKDHVLLFTGLPCEIAAELGMTFAGSGCRCKEVMPEAILEKCKATGACNCYVKVTQPSIEVTEARKIAASCTHSQADVFRHALELVDDRARIMFLNKVGTTEITFAAGLASIVRSSDVDRRMFFHQIQKKHPRDVFAVTSATLSGLGLLRQRVLEMYDSSDVAWISAKTTDEDQRLTFQQFDRHIRQVFPKANITRAQTVEVMRVIRSNAIYAAACWSGVGELCNLDVAGQRKRRRNFVRRSMEVQNIVFGKAISESELMLGEKIASFKEKLVKIVRRGFEEVMHEKSWLDASKNFPGSEVSMSDVKKDPSQYGEDYFVKSIEIESFWLHDHSKARVLDPSQKAKDLLVSFAIAVKDVETWDKAISEFKDYFVTAAQEEWAKEFPAKEFPDFKSALIRFVTSKDGLYEDEYKNSFGVSMVELKRRLKDVQSEKIDKINQARTRGEEIDIGEYETAVCYPLHLSVKDCIGSVQAELEMD